MSKNGDGGKVTGVELDLREILKAALQITFSFEPPEIRCLALCFLDDARSILPEVKVQHRQVRATHRIVVMSLPF